MATKVITVHFTSAGIPVTGLTPLVDIWEVNPDSQVVNNGVCVEVGQGWYRYNFTTYDYTKSYVFTFDGGGTLTACDRYKVGGNESYVEDISYEVWEEPGASHTTAGTTGQILNLIKADTSTIIIDVAAVKVLVETLIKLETGRTKVDTIAKTLTIYDDDCVTPLIVFDLLDSGGNPSVTEVCERKPQFCP